MEGNQQQFVITLKTFFGFEQTLQEELSELGYKDVAIKNRAVQLKGSWNDVYRLNYLVRCAISVLVEIKRFNIRQEQDLYEGAKQIRWHEWFGSQKTFAVKGAVFGSVFKHSQYPYLLVKDAIVDRFREAGEERPNVNVKAPNVMVDLYIQNNEVIISLNTSGLPLFQRGYRQSVGEAPLNEVVAAGLIRMSGWDRKSAFLDPFCGSGTLLIEAGMLAAGIPAAYERNHFAFMSLKNFQQDAWQSFIEEQDYRKPIQLDFPLIGVDIKDEMVMNTKRNARALGLARHLDIQSGHFKNISLPQEKGMIITNPPYGERMGDEVEELYGEFGTWLKHDMSGWSACVISSNNTALNQIGLKPSFKQKVYNGDLECSFRKYDLFEGTHKEKVIAEME